jgi:hypothetical protein
MSKRAIILFLLTAPLVGFLVHAAAKATQDEIDRSVKC